MTRSSTNSCFRTPTATVASPFSGAPRAGGVRSGSKTTAHVRATTSAGARRGGSVIAAILVRAGPVRVRSRADGYGRRLVLPDPHPPVLRVARRRVLPVLLLQLRQLVCLDRLA